MGEIKKRQGIYDMILKACKYRDTSITRVLNTCGRSDGNTGTWKAGGFPRVDVVMDIAELLDLSLDEVCYGLNNSATVRLDDNQREWLAIIRRIPADRQEICKEFLKTHATIPDVYADDAKKVS